LNCFSFYDGSYVAEAGAEKAIKKALFQWTLPGQFYKVYRLIAQDSLITYNNMVYQGIYEVGCNFVVCHDSYKLIDQAVLMCVYNTK
ncbi:hypothetical protein TELCIR_05494, partial [Teladorsagia circumcincta]